MKQKVVIALIAILLAVIVAGCSNQESKTPEETKGAESTTTPAESTLFTGEELSLEEAKEKAIEYVNKNLVMPGTNATAISVEDKGSVYEIMTLYQQREIPVYISKDGHYLFLNSINISKKESEVTYSTEELQKFADCLEKAGLKIYGAKWCPHCQKLVNMLGGYDVVKNIYVECTEQQEVCNKEGITAYPTIKINGEEYTGMRTFEGLSEATGCSVPQAEEPVEEGTVEAPAELSAEEAKEKAIEYVNKNLVMPGTNATAISVEDKGSVYEIMTLYQQREIPVYISKDGHYLFLNALDTTKELPKITPTVTPTPATTQTTPEYSTEELQKFADCLEKAGLKIYGAKWCPHCQKLVNMLGGYDVVKNIYVECTEQQEVCNKEGITAYPTIKINGTLVTTGETTFEKLSEATGCPVPEK